VANKTKVLIVSDYAYASGGIEHMVSELIAGFSDDFECTLLTWYPDAVAPEGFSGIITLDYGDLREAWPAMENADVLLVQTSFNTRLLARLAGEFLSLRPKPALTVVHTTSHSRPEATYRGMQEGWLAQLLDASSKVVAVSTDVEKALRALPTADAGDWRIVVVENAARLAATPVRAKGRSTVSFIGRPSPQKGWSDFTRLAADLAGRGLTFTANTVHAAPEAPAPGITLCHQLSDEQMIGFLDRADVLIVPYRFADGLPLAVLEALNCGVPVIGYDSDGLGRLLRQAGQHVVKPDYDSLRCAVEDWAAGRLTVTAPEPMSMRSWAQAVAEYASHVTDIVNGKTARVVDLFAARSGGPITHAHLLSRGGQIDWKAPLAQLAPLSASDDPAISSPRADGNVGGLQ
jgi:glycosyltransferase involved in cell wall biosynthesis